jgi:hypothetical protein
MSPEWDSAATQRRWYLTHRAPRLETPGGAAPLLRWGPPGAGICVLEEVGLVLELELRVDVVTAEPVTARRIDAVAIPSDQREALGEGDREVGADAGEAAAGQAMAPDVVDPRVVAQELEVDPILAGPDRRLGEVPPRRIPARTS